MFSVGPTASAQIPPDTFPICVTSGSNSVVCVDVAPTTGPGLYEGEYVRVYSSKFMFSQRVDLRCFDGIPPGGPVTSEETIQCNADFFGPVDDGAVVAGYFGGTCTDVPEPNNDCFGVYYSGFPGHSVRIHVYNNADEEICYFTAIDGTPGPWDCLPLILAS